MAYATGKHAVGFCMRCGLPWKYAQLRDDGQVRGLRVCPDCWEPEHPQETPAKPRDPIALRRSAPENIASGTFLVEYPLYQVDTNSYFGQQLLQFTHGQQTTADVLLDPSNLAVSAVTSSRVDLSWSDNSSSEDGFKIERCSGAGCSSFSQIGTAAANATTYFDTTVVPNTTYRYRVRAYKGSTNSGYTNEVQQVVPYTTTAKDYDGSTYGERVGGLSGIADGPRGTFRICFRKDSSDGASAALFCLFESGGGAGQFLVELDSSNRLRVSGTQPSAANAFARTTTATYLASPTWTDLLMSWDLPTSTVQMYVATGNGDYQLVSAFDLSVTVNANINYTTNRARLASHNGTGHWEGCICEAFFHTAHIDLSIAANREKFRLSGKPVYLGAAGELPLGVQPLGYWPGGDPANNLGTGGTLTVTGSLTACSSSPTD